MSLLRHVFMFILSIIFQLLKKSSFHKDEKKYLCTFEQIPPLASIGKAKPHCDRLYNIVSEAAQNHLCILPYVSIFMSCSMVKEDMMAGRFKEYLHKEKSQSGMIPWMDPLADRTMEAGQVVSSFGYYCSIAQHTKVFVVSNDHIADTINLRIFVRP